MTNEEFLQAVQGAKLLEEAVIARLKRESALSDKPAEELMYAQRLVDDQKIAAIKSQLLKVPHQKVDFAHFDKTLLDLIPEETVRAYKVAPIAKKDNLLVAGMLYPDNLKAQDALKFIARRNRLNLGVYLLSFSDWQEFLRIYSPYRSQVQEAVQSLGFKTGGEVRKLVQLGEGATSGFEEAPIIRIVANTFEEAVQRGVSDVHIEPQENYLRIRFRIDGELQEEAALPLELAQAVVSRVKVISNLKIDEIRIPQDGRFRTKILSREVDFRVSTLPTPLGEKVAVRVLDPTTGLKDFNELGLVGKNLEMVKAGLEKPFGLILVTGPTGSGKTTTLYALLRTLNKEALNIVSLEDPVEYLVGGINQSQVRPEIGYDFASGLRQILRQDPDVIMVGEIRDNETASLAIQAALTGHIVLSTLHTNNAVSVIPRLVDMKVDSFLLPVSLNLMIGQRLVGLLCGSCKTSDAAKGELLEVIKRAMSELPAEVREKHREPYHIYRAPGCPKCRGRGIIGRVALFEVFRMSPELQGIINTGPTIQKILHEAKAQGMITLRQDGVLKALGGLVSLENVVRETEEF